MGILWGGCYGDDRPYSAGGGTAVEVRTSVGHHRVDLLHRAYLDATTEEIHGTLGGVLVVAAYKTPKRELLHPDLVAAFDAYRLSLIHI